MNSDLHGWCLGLLTSLATAPLVESNTRRELLEDALRPVPDGARLATEIEDLAYTLTMSHRQNGADTAIQEAIGDAAVLLADALAGDTVAAGRVAA